MQMSGVYWYENPGRRGVTWPSHVIHKARAMEGSVLGDIAGRPKVGAHYRVVPISGAEAPVAIPLVSNLTASLRERFIG